MRSEQRRWLSEEPVDLAQTLSSLRRGARDPAITITAADTWWCTQTPDGPGTIHLTARPREGAVDAQAWGVGSLWLLEQLPPLIGAFDCPGDFAPEDPVVSKAWRRNRAWRIGATARVFEACVAAVIEQKVTGMEARTSWRHLLLRFGEPAPGPTPTRMFTPPLPSVWTQIPDWDFRAAGLTPQRIRTLRAVATAATAIERTVNKPAAEADAMLRALPGVGVWTSAEVRQRALGDADAVSFGDFHIAKNLCWWLTGSVGDDERMAQLLEPFNGHRYRVQRLMELEGVHRPRRGPRFAPPAHRVG